MHEQVWSCRGPEQHEVFGRLRQSNPVWSDRSPWTGRRCWFVTRYQDVVEIASDQRFGVDPNRVPDGDAPRVVDTDQFEFLERHLLHLDPPDHTRLRALVNRAFTPRRVKALEPRIAGIANSLLDELDHGGEIDLMRDFAVPMPLTVIAELLGVPVSDHELFRRWVTIALGNEGLDEGGVSEGRDQAGREFLAYLRSKIDEKRKAPADDLLSDLIHVEEHGDRLSNDELLAMIYLLSIAGHETTMNGVGNGMYVLTQHPDALITLQNDPGSLPTAIEEMIRYEPPVGMLMTRFASETTKFGGQTIEAGDAVYAILLAANRDPDVFSDPDRFDIRRDQNRHLGFGFGIHYCIGGPLARTELRVAFEALLGRYQSIELAVDPEQLDWSEFVFLRGLQSLPLAVSR